MTKRLLHEENKIKNKQQIDKERGEIYEDNALLTRKHIPNRDHGPPKCFHCGRIGHKKINCWDLMEEQDSRQFGRSSENRENANVMCNSEYAWDMRKYKTEDEKYISLMVKNKTNDVIKRNRDWIIDSGATSHMCNDRKLFVDLNDKNEEVELGDGYTVAVKGSGRIKMEMEIPGRKTKLCMLSEVLYVPDLSYNLMSVSKMVKNGKGIEFKGDSCLIVDKNGDKIGEARNHGNLYYVQCRCIGLETTLRVREKNYSSIKRENGYSRKLFSSKEF